MLGFKNSFVKRCFCVGLSACMLASVSGDLPGYVVYAAPTEDKEADIVCDRAVSDIPSGNIDYKRSVTLSTASKGGKIYYTLDGSMPGESSILYNEAIKYDELKKNAVLGTGGDDDEITELKTVCILEKNGKKYYSDVTIYEYTFFEKKINAYEINIPGLFREKIEKDGECDYYSFSLNKRTDMTFTLDYSEKSLCGLTLLNKDMNVLATSEYGYSQKISFELGEGEYYIKVDGISGCDNTGYTLRAGTTVDNTTGSVYGDRSALPSVEEVLYVPEGEDIYEEAVKNYIYTYGAVSCTVSNKGKNEYYVLTGWNDDNFICADDEELKKDTVISNHVPGGSFAVNSDYNMKNYEDIFGDMINPITDIEKHSGLTGMSRIYTAGDKGARIDAVSFSAMTAGIPYIVEVVAEGVKSRVASGTTSHAGINSVMCDGKVNVAAGKSFETIVWFYSFDKYDVPLEKVDDDCEAYIITSESRKKVSDQGLAPDILVYANHNDNFLNDKVNMLFSGNAVWDAGKPEIKNSFTALPKQYNGNDAYENIGTIFGDSFDLTYAAKVKDTLREMYPDIKNEELNDRISAVRAGEIAAWVNVHKKNYQLFNRADIIVLSAESQMDVNITSTSGTDIVLAASLGNNVDDNYIVWKISGESDIYNARSSVSRSGENVTVCRVKKKGKITITAAARSNPGLSKSVTVNISKINTNKVTDRSMHIVKKISLNKKSIVMKRGKKKKLKVKVTPSNASNAQISWQSSNRKVAVVNRKGVVTAKRGGKCYITAINEFSRKSASCKIIVGYSIKYHPRGGKNNSKNRKAYMRGDHFKLKNAKRPGYIFLGWYSKKSLKPKYRVKAIKKTTHRDYVLYAKWRKKK